MKMKVFLSWSGDRSNCVARILRDCLPKILPKIDVFLSDVDMALGALWPPTLGKELDTARVGIVILTTENIGSPWLHYEAGTLKDRLIPLRFQVLPEECGRVFPQLHSLSIEGPDDLIKLAMEINAKCDPQDRRTEPEIEAAIKKHCSDLGKHLNDISPSKENKPVYIQRSQGADPTSLLPSLKDQVAGVTDVRSIAAIGREFWRGCEQLIPEGANCTIILGDLDAASIELWSKAYPFRKKDIAEWIRCSIGYFAMLPNATVQFMNSYVPFSILATEHEERGKVLVVSFHIYKSESKDRPLLVLKPDRHEHWYDVFSKQFELAKENAKPFQVDGNAKVRKVSTYLLLPLATPGKGKLALALNYGQLVNWWKSDGTRRAKIHGHRIASMKDLMNLPILPLVERKASKKDIEAAISAISDPHTDYQTNFNVNDLRPVVPFRWLSVEAADRKSAAPLSSICELVNYPEVAAVIDGTEFRHPEVRFIGQMRSKTSVSSPQPQPVHLPRKWREIKECELCSCYDFRVVHIIGRSRVVECKKCGLHFQNPQSCISHDQCDKYASNGDDKGRRGMSSQARAKQYAEIIISDLRQMEKDICEGPILDVGCASGEFLDALTMESEVCKENLYGIEPSKLAAKYVKDRYNCQVWNGFAEEVDLTQSPGSKILRFKFVFLLNSFEHLYQPGDVLCRIRDVLDSDGLLGVFTVPNVDSLMGRLFPMGFMSKNFPDAEDHFFFTSDSLVKLVESKGFQTCSAIGMANPFGRRRDIVENQTEATARWLAFNCGVPVERLHATPTLLKAWSEQLGATEAVAKDLGDNSVATIQGLEDLLKNAAAKANPLGEVVDFWRENIWKDACLSEACGVWFKPK